MLGAGSFFVSALVWSGAEGKVGPCGGTGSSLAGRVFRLDGLWWPKSLRSKATHTPAILEATRATLPAPDLAKAGE